jgi:uncharacterized membrane protein
MKSLLQWLGVAAVCALIGYVGIFVCTPYLLMGVAMRKMSGPGRAVNQFMFPPRTTEASRAVVRPSPDLAYASCVYDLSKGPLRVHAPPWSDYMSISVFQADSDNIFALNDRQAPTGIDFVLARKGQATPAGARVVISPSVKGIVLDRRLAPTADAFAQADAARKGDICETIAPSKPA